MNTSRRALILLAALVLTMSFAVPAEDVAATAYDESASVPYVSVRVVSLTGRETAVEVSVVSSAVREYIAEAPALRPHTSPLRLGYVRRLGAQPRHRTTGWACRVFGSITILDHSLRC